MKKLHKFFKAVWNILIAVPVVIFVLIVIILGFIFAILEAFFKQGRIMAVVFLRGIAAGAQKEKEIETIMQATMKSKRVH